MALDTNIALGVRPIEQPNMLAQMGQMMALRQAQQSYEQQNALRGAFAQGTDISDPESFKRIAAIDPKLAFELKSKHLEQQQKSVDTGIKVNEALGGGLEWLSKNPSLDNAKNLFSDLVNKGVLPSDKAQAMFAKLQAEPDKIAYYANLGYQTAISAEKRMTDATTQRGQNLTHSASMASVGATIRGQDLTDKRAREQLHTIETGTGPGTYTQFGPNAGVITPMTQAPWSPPGSPAAPVAAPAPAYGGGGALGSGTFGVSAPTGTSALTGGATPPAQTNMLLRGNQPVVANPGYTQAQPKGPSAITTVNAYVPASEAAQGEYIKSTRATFDQLKHAPTVLENIEKAKALVPTAKGFMGTGGNAMLEAAKFMNNRLGTNIDTAGVKSAEELNSRVFMGVLDNLKKMDAQPSQSQQAALQQALGSLGTDPNAMGAVLDVFGDIVRGKVDIHNQEVTDAEKRGTKFPYNPVIKLPPRAVTASPPIYATNGKERIMSTDGGNTWQPAGAK